jgi:internalin A
MNAKVFGLLGVWLLFLNVAWLSAGEAQERAAKAIRKAGGYASGSLGTEQKQYTVLDCYPETDMDAVLLELRSLPDLSLIRMRKVATDEHLRALVGLPRVTTLELSGSKVSDQGMKFVLAHPNLLDLTLVDTKIGDAGAAEIAKLGKLRRLYMANTLVSEMGLRELQKIKTLEELMIGPSFGDEGIDSVAKLTNLKFLSLPGAPITAKGLKKLHPLKGIVQLGLKVTI